MCPSGHDDWVKYPSARSRRCRECDRLARLYRRIKDLTSVFGRTSKYSTCLLYTSDAADE